MPSIDALDVRLIELLTAEPRIGVLEASRRLQVARGTVQARLDRLVASGVIRSFAPTLDPTITGQGDLMCRLVARDNDDLQRVIDVLVADDDVLRTATVVALACVIAHRTLPLARAGS